MNGNEQTPSDRSDVVGHPDEILTMFGPLSVSLVRVSLTHKLIGHRCNHVVAIGSGDHSVELGVFDVYHDRIPDDELKSSAPSHPAVTITHKDESEIEHPQYEPSERVLLGISKALKPIKAPHMPGNEASAHYSDQQAQYSRRG